MIELIKENENLIVAITAAFAALTAIVSIILTFISIFLQQKHNRISVAPIGQISGGDYENHIYVDILNNGLGPMVLEKLEISSVDNNSSYSSLVKLMPTMPKGLVWETFSTASEGTVITAQGHKRLLSLRINAASPEHVSYADRVRRSLGELTIQFTYCDMYGKRQNQCKREMSWFLRRFK
jgi:hypothetical protein